MLADINMLEPFFKDNYRRINVREYARISKISPPFASKVLSRFEKEGLLTKEVERNYIYYSSNRDDKTFIDFSRIYWRIILRGVVEKIEREMMDPIVVLFGSFSKAEVKKDSDIDIAVFSQSKKDMDLKQYEEKIGRNIHLFIFKNQNDVRNKDLLKNILNGFILSGGW